MRWLCFDDFLDIVDICDGAGKWFPRIIVFAIIDLSVLSLLGIILIFMGVDMMNMEWRAGG